MSKNPARYLISASHLYYTDLYGTGSILKLDVASNFKMTRPIQKEAWVQGER